MSGLTQEDVAPKLQELRSIFKEKYKANIANGEYDQRDLDRLENDDIYAGRFLIMLKAKGDPDKASEAIDTCFKFRQEMKIWDYTEADIPEKIKTKNAIYFKNKDKEGRKIMYINVKENNPADKEEAEQVKRFVAYTIDKQQRAETGERCVALMDMSGAGVSNLNLDITKYMIHCFTTYFPSFLAYMINYEMPLLLTATWKVISSFMSSEQRDFIKMVKKKDLDNYLDNDNKWDHMK